MPGHGTRSARGAPRPNSAHSPSWTRREHWGTSTLERARHTPRGRPRPRRRRPLDPRRHQPRRARAPLALGHAADRRALQLRPRRQRRSLAVPPSSPPAPTQLHVGRRLLVLFVIDSFAAGEHLTLRLRRSRPRPGRRVRDHLRGPPRRPGAHPTRRHRRPRRDPRHRRDPRPSRPRVGRPRDDAPPADPSRRPRRAITRLGAMSARRLHAPIVLPCEQGTRVLRDAVVDVDDAGRIAHVGPLARPRRRTPRRRGCRACSCPGSSTPTRTRRWRCCGGWAATCR